METFTTAALEQGTVVQDLYERIFTEPPYLEGPEDFEDFRASWADRARQPGFRLVVASDPNPVGFAFGRTLPGDTGWWSGLLTPAPPDLVQEWDGRSFGINEIAVLPEWRRRGVARAMHRQLLRGTGTERAVLLVRPEAEAAQTAYKRWGYQLVGQVRPYKGAPIYDGMVLDSRTRRGDQVGSGHPTGP